MDDAFPEVRYARSGDVHIAYQVLGEGDVDLVFVMGWLTNLETYWELPGYRRFMQRLAGFTRLILFDKRGMGLSDRSVMGTLEERMDDVRAVMDAAGSERAVLLGVSEGAPLSMVFAATHPERTAGLIFVGGEVKEILEDDWPWDNRNAGGVRGNLERSSPARSRGERPKRVWFAPSKEYDPAVMEWRRAPRTNRCFTRGGSRVHAARQRDRRPPRRAVDPRADARPARCPGIRSSRSNRAAGSPSRSREPASSSWRARTTCPGSTSPIRSSPRSASFLTGFREAAEPEQILATVLFTDIVGSTERAQELGDNEWRLMLERHHATVRDDPGPLPRTRDRYGWRRVPRVLRRAGAGDPLRRRGARRPRLDSGSRSRSGLHTGEVEVVGDKLAGIAVHIGARVAALAGPGEVLVSSTVRDLVAGSGIEFEDRGLHELKGLDEPRRLYAVRSGVTAAAP